MTEQDKVGVYEKSNSRGVLTRQIYFNQKQDLERKRKQMKSILDQQVEQRRKKKQIQKIEQQKLNKIEQQKIRAYHMRLQARQKVNTLIGSKKLSMKQKRNDIEFKQKKIGRYTEKTIPVMLVQQSQSKGQLFKNNSKVKSNEKLSRKKMYHNSVGNLPLLDISPQQEQNKRKQTRIIMKNKPPIKKIKKMRKNSLLDDEKNKSSQKEMVSQINEQLECQNNELKSELKKNKEALTFLLGAVKSNKRMQKLKMKAENILYGTNIKNNKRQTSIRVNIQKQQFMLPNLKVHHQSMMHDFMFGSAKKALNKKSKLSN